VLETELRAVLHLEVRPLTVESLYMRCDQLECLSGLVPET